MIKYNLICDKEHEFESWFSSSREFEKLKKNRLLEIERFGTAALPYYVILSPDDEVLGTFPGMDTNKDNFINFLNNSRSNFED